MIVQLSSINLLDYPKPEEQLISLVDIDRLKILSDHLLGQGRKILSIDSLSSIFKTFQVQLYIYLKEFGEASLF